MSHETTRYQDSSGTSPQVHRSNTPTAQTIDRSSTLANGSSAAAVQHMRQRPASSVPTVSVRPTPPPSSTPPEQRISRPIGVENLLNPATGGSSESGNRRHDAARVDSPRAVPTISMSRPATPSMAPVIGGRPISGDITLPSITPPLTYNLPHSISRAMTPRSPTSYGPTPFSAGLPAATIDAKQSPFIVPRENSSTEQGSLHYTSTATAPIGASTAYAATSMPLHSSPQARQICMNGHHPTTYSRKSIIHDGPGNAAVSQFTSSRSSSPSIYQQQTPPPQTTSTGQPQSFFSGPFTSAGPASTMAQLAFDKRNHAVTAPTGHGQYQMMTLETESGPIQVPVDVQAASKVADEKRKRNATASHRFRQRRKEKEQETSNNISKLEAQVRQVTEEKDFYQRERDFLQDVVQSNRIPVPPRPASPRRRRHASLGGAALQKHESENTRDEGRNTRRRTSAYIPPQGPAPHSAEALPIMPSFERLSSIPSEHLQGLQQRMRPQGPFHPAANPFDPSAPR